MKKSYLVKKNPNATAEWIEMNGKQFYEFISSPAGKGRYFMDCDTYEIEVTHEQYREWKLEVNHHNYLQGFEDEVLILSFENIRRDNYIPVDELFADLSANVEDEVIKNIDFQLLAEAVQSLPDDERRLIGELFMRDKPKTEQEIAKAKGVSQQAIHKRKNKILKKIKMLVVKSQKSQQ